MKKLMLLILITLGVSFAFANGNEGMKNRGKAELESVISQGEPRVEVLSAEFNGKDKIVVTVRLYADNDDCHDVKVYPTNNMIISSVTASTRTVTICHGNYSNANQRTETVEFPCMSQKTEDLQYCNAYAFEAQILN